MLTVALDDIVCFVATRAAERSSYPDDASGHAPQTSTRSYRVNHWLQPVMVLAITIANGNWCAERRNKDALACIKW